MTERGQLPKAYLRLDPNIDQTHPDTKAMVRLMCVSNRQPHRGHFKNRQLAESILGKRDVKTYLDRGDLEVLPSGELYVDGWEEWQEGDWTVGERQNRIRAKRRAKRDTVTVESRPDNAASVTEPLSRPLPPSEALGRLGVKAEDVLPHTPSARDGLPNITKEVQAAGEAITGRGILAAGERQLTELDRLVEDHGVESVVRAMQAVAQGERMTWVQVVWGARKRLEPIPGALPSKEQQKADTESADQARWAKEREATQRRIAELRELSA